MDICRKSDPDSWNSLARPEEKMHVICLKKNKEVVWEVEERKNDRR